MKKIVATLLVVSAMSVGCVRKVDQGLTVASNENTRTHHDKGLVPDMIEDWDFIKLETSASSLLYDAWDIAIDDGLIFVHSRPSNINGGQKNDVSLRVFDTQGKYLHDIGMSGRGPGEYGAILSWGVNKAENYITIVDFDKILKFDYRGKLLDKPERDPDSDMYALFRLREWDYLPDGKILGHNVVMGGSDVQIGLMDGNLNTIDTLAAWGFRLNDENGFSELGTSWMSTYGDHVMVSRDFSDTILTYRTGRLVPEIFLDISRSMDGITLTDGMNRDQVRESLKARGYEDKKMANIYETDAYWVFDNNVAWKYMIGHVLDDSETEDKTRTLVWDKAAGRGVMLGKSDPASTVPFAPVVCTDGEMLTWSTQAYKIIEYRDNCAKHGVEITPRMQALFDGLAEDDNPVLIRYKLKADSELFR